VLKRIYDEASTRESHFAICLVAFALFRLVALKNLLHVLQLAFCAIHSLIEKDQKVCFRKVWQVCSSIVNLCTFLCLLMAQIYWQKMIWGDAMPNASLSPRNVPQKVQLAVDREVILQ
jgi:hypothetical protein